MLKRTISAIVALPLLFFVLFKGGVFLFLAALILSLIGQFEFYRAFSKTHDPVVKLGYVMTLFWYLGLYFNLPKAYETLCISVYLFGILSHIIISKKESVLFDEMIGFIGFFYVSFTISHILLISNYHNAFFIWYPFIIAFSSDTFAYFTGRFFGKHKLIPSVSPKKTIEGAVGGLVLCTILSGVYANIWYPDFVGYAILLGFIGSALSMVGDLIASRIKRITHIKDFGKIMPGHGGVLDRFDSLIVTIPLVYYFIVIFEWLH
ncbi:MAG: phosphatidate cytidylyltransferase [Clostridiales bacterium]|jgi:phosphatidate cytidylyltransferase|nr:phosphatidate cytidylyltransferase [Clostridiales bacterium]MDN5298156.1 phosphatidate cytidylyltransferase [Clostridiales bacterium]